VARDPWPAKITPYGVTTNEDPPSASPRENTLFACFAVEISWPGAAGRRVEEESGVSSCFRNYSIGDAGLGVIAAKDYCPDAETTAFRRVRRKRLCRGG
jgi:hypothetical protein